jgi:hypothetical protein
MCSLQRGFSILIIAVLSVAACKRRDETQSAAGAPATASAPTPGTPEQPAAPGPKDSAAAALPWVTEPACKLRDGDRLDPILDVPCLYTWATPAGATPLVVHFDDGFHLRLVAELEGVRTLVVHLPEVNVARGTGLYVRPQADQRLAVVLTEDWSDDGSEEATDYAWLLSRTGKTIDVTQVRGGGDPLPAWAAPSVDGEAAAAPTAGSLPRPEPLAGCKSGLTSPEQVCECLVKLLGGEDADPDLHSCDVKNTRAAGAKIAEVMLEADGIYVIMHRIGDGWAALFRLGGFGEGDQSSGVLDVVKASKKTFGSRQALWIEAEHVFRDANDDERYQVVITRTLTLCLVSEAGEPTCVLQVPLFHEERAGRLPDELASDVDLPREHFAKLSVVSSYRLRVDVSDDGKATITLASGELPRGEEEAEDEGKDMRALLGSHALW